MATPLLTSKVKPKEFTERLLAAVAVLSIVVAWYVGLKQSRADLIPYLQLAVPSANQFESLSDTSFAARQDGHLVGYVSIGKANGYGGPFEVAVAVDLQGNISGLAVIDQKETPSFYKQVQKSDFIETFIGKSSQDPWELGNDLDGISGATYTSRAIAQAVQQGGRRVAGEYLGLTLPTEHSPKIQIGAPEIVLVILFATGFIGHRQKFKYTKQVRWISMITGLVLLGFLFNRPLTISAINQLLLGYWPIWQTNLYWYLLIGGILFVFSADNKNPYCEWFCPFGAAQECVGAIGGAKVRSPGKYKTGLKWMQRALAWFAILLALLYRNPGISSYEIFGTLFDLVGSSYQFALLGIVLVVALFIKRPWCSFLCPLRPIEEFIRMIRKWVVETWKTIVHASV